MSKEYKVTVYDFFKQIKALEAFGINLNEAEIIIEDKGHISINDKKNKKEIDMYLDNGIFPCSTHIFTKR